MKSPPRIIDRAGDSVGARLVRSARAEVPPAASRQRAMAAAALAAATVSSVSTKAAAAGALPRAATVKWLAWSGGGLVLAVSLGAAVTTAGNHAATPRSSATAANAVAPSSHVIAAPLSPSSLPLSASSDAPLAGTDTRAALPAAPPSLPVATAAAGPRASTARSSNLPGLASELARELAPASVDSPTARSTLTQEVAVLDEAKRALDDSRAEASLAILDRHAREFPRGSLAPEATALRIEALYRRGDRAGAARLFRRFEESNPKSPLLEHVRPFASADTKRD